MNRSQIAEQQNSRLGSESAICSSAIRHLPQVWLVEEAAGLMRFFWASGMPKVKGVLRGPYPTIVAAETAGQAMGAEVRALGRAGRWVEKAGAA